MPSANPKKPRPRGFHRSRIPTTELGPKRHGTFRSHDGTKLFYSVEGSGGPPLVFCYGLVCSSLHWTYQIDHFQKNYEVVWMDYRAHQNSKAPKDLKSLTIENLASDLLLLLDRLHIPQAVLVGHSLGSSVILEAYRQSPSRVAGLVLSNGTARRPLESMFHMNAFQGAFKLLRRAHERSPLLISALWKAQNINPLAKHLVAHGGFNPRLSAEGDIKKYIEQVSEMDPKVFLHLIEAYDSYDATAWLHSIEAPTLIIAGEKDHMIPLHQQRLLHQLIPGSRLEIIRQGSHCPQMDLPGIVNLKIERFLEEMGYSSSQALVSNFPAHADAATFF